MVNLFELLSFVAFIGLMLLLRQCAPVASWLPLVFSNSFLPRMLLVLVLISITGSFFTSCIASLVGMRLNATWGGFFWWRVFGLSVLDAVCLRIGYVSFTQRYAVAPAVEPRPTGSCAASCVRRPGTIRASQTPLAHSCPRHAGNKLAPVPDQPRARACHCLPRNRFGPGRQRMSQCARRDLLRGGVLFSRIPRADRLSQERIRRSADILFCGLKIAGFIGSLFLLTWRGRSAYPRLRNVRFLLLLCLFFSMT